MKCFIEIVCLFLAEASWACPLCKDNIPLGMARGFFWSILLMIAVPAVVVGVIARAVWRAEKKKNDPADFHPE